MTIEGKVNFLALLAWIAVIGMMAFVAFRSRENPIKGGGALIGIITIIAMVLSTVGAGLVFVEPNEIGLVISALAENGVREEGLPRGLSWIVPVFEHVEKYPRGIQEYTMGIAPKEGQISEPDYLDARTSDGQVVDISATVIFRIDPEKIVQVHTLRGHGYLDNFIRVQTRGIIRGAVAEYSVEEIMTTHRQDLIADIEAEMAVRLEDGGFELIDFVLRNVVISNE